VSARPTSREEAKRIILAIIALAGGRFDSKTALFKAFYAAHLYYWNDSPGVLTTHPIARMTLGPGIDDHEAILKELEQEGLISVEITPVGPRRQNTYVTTVDAEINGDEKQAILKALNWVKGKSASEISEWSHQYSRTWQNGENGDLLAIYLDILSDKEHEEIQQHLSSAKKILDKYYV